MFKQLISLKLTVRATVIALKLQLSFCQDSW